MIKIGTFCRYTCQNAYVNENVKSNHNRQMTSHLDLGSTANFLPTVHLP